MEEHSVIGCYTLNIGHSLSAFAAVTCHTWECCDTTTLIGVFWLAGRQGCYGHKATATACLMVLYLFRSRMPFFSFFFGE